MAASKIASHELDAFLEIGEALLQVFDVFSHFVSLRLSDSTLGRRLLGRGERCDETPAIINASEARMHSHANQSPKRTYGVSPLRKS